MLHSSASIHFLRSHLRWGANESLREDSFGALPAKKWPGGGRKTVHCRTLWSHITRRISTVHTDKERQIFLIFAYFGLHMKWNSLELCSYFFESVTRLIFLGEAPDLQLTIYSILSLYLMEKLNRQKLEKPWIYDFCLFVCLINKSTEFSVLFFVFLSECSIPRLDIQFFSSSSSKL